MICRKCGELLDDKEKFCPACGAAQETAEYSRTVLNPEHSYSENCSHEGHVVGGSTAITFVEAMKLYFTRFADFRGRSRRSEYWWAILGTGIISGVLETVAPGLAWVWFLVTLVPGLALCVRRLHDIGKSGWYYLVTLIPVAGIIIYIVWACRDSDGHNQWGLNPKD